MASEPPIISREDLDALLYRNADLEAALRAIISRCDDPEGMSAEDVVDLVRNRAAMALGLPAYLW